ncbi:PH domain-containing protein [Lysobacter humi (ex Lee et al. 2017)]
MDPSPDLPPPAAPWQPLPQRARLPIVLGLLPAFVLPLTVAPTVLAVASDRMSPLVAGALGLLAGIVIAAWRGLREYRCIAWRLDAEGLAVRRGALWQRETRVPASRVQHLDLKRGPLQRRRRLSTLVVHTAGTRAATVALPHLDEAEAERLRDALSRRADDVDG